MKEFGAKVREGFGEKWGTLVDAVGVRRSKDARKASILVSAHSLRMPVENHALLGGAFTTNPERTPQIDLTDFPEQTEVMLQSPQVLSSLLDICLLRNWLTPSLAAVQLSAHLSQVVPPHPRTIKESDMDYLESSQLPGIALGEVEKFKDVHGFDRLAQNLESSNNSRAGDAKKAIQNWGNVQIVDSSFRGRFSCVESPVC